MRTKNSLLLIFISLIMIGFSSCGEKEPEEEPEPEIIEGCMDSESLNYNPLATKDNNSCKYASVTRNRSMILSFTSPTFGECGDYRADIVNTAKNTHGPLGVVALEVHIDGNLSSQIGNAWMAKYNPVSYPMFVANSTVMPQGQHPSSGINDLFNSQNVQAPRIVLHHEAKEEEGFVSGTAYMQAAVDLSGTYNMGIYIVGYNIKAPQAGTDGSAYPDLVFDQSTKTYPEYVHGDVLHAEAFNQAFGSMGFEGETKQFTTAKFDYKTAIASNWSTDFKVVLIVWNVDGSNLQMQNIYMVE